MQKILVCAFTVSTLFFAVTWLRHTVGKTHTMQGTNEDRGIIPRAMEQVGAYMKSQIELGWEYKMVGRGWLLLRFAEVTQPLASNTWGVRIAYFLVRKKITSSILYLAFVFITMKSIWRFIVDSNLCFCSTTKRPDVLIFNNSKAYFNLSNDTLSYRLAGRITITIHMLTFDDALLSRTCCIGTANCY